MVEEEPQGHLKFDQQTAKVDSGKGEANFSKSIENKLYKQHLNNHEENLKQPNTENIIN